MKKYFAGLLTGVLAMGLALSALAITGRMTIEVDPINIQVNGQTFAPTDVNGAEVPVFAYNGTTYAPLRALAEAYGLEVGYDAATNMATVQAPDAQPAADQQTGDAQSKPGLVQTEAADYDHWSAEDEAAYQEFKGMWELTEIKPSDSNPEDTVYVFHCVRDDVSDDDMERIQNEDGAFIKRMIVEYSSSNQSKENGTIIGKFTNGTRGFFRFIDNY